MLQSQWATVLPPAGPSKPGIVVTAIRKLTPVENRGRHHIYARYFENGVEVRGAHISLRSGWNGGPAALSLLDKPTSEPAVNVPMGKATYWAEMVVNGVSSERVDGLHTHWPDETMPDDGMGGCSKFHHSFEIHFERVTAQQPAPAPVAAPVIPSAPQQQAHSIHIFGMHDPSPEWEGWVREAGRTGWAVHTEAIGCDPNDRSGKNYVRPGITALVRLNNGYEPAGTIPRRERYADFARRCANFVAASPGCDWVIIGNEIGLRVEWPQGERITLADYVDCFLQCRAAIKAVRPGVKVMPQAVAPWDIGLGDWCQQLAEMLRLIGASNVDGIPLHAYTHGHFRGLVRDAARMEPPYQHRYFNFRVFQDFLRAVPAAFRHLPVFITEANPNGWDDVDNGWIFEVYDLIDEWNRDAGNQAVWCVAFYRFWKHDQEKYWISSKPGVLADFRRALGVDRRIPLRKQQVAATVSTLVRARLRRSPGQAGETIGIMEAGAVLQDHGNRAEANELTWVYAAHPDFGSGWVAVSAPNGTQILAFA